MTFPQLKVGQVGYFDGKKIVRVSNTEYSVHGIKYSKSALTGLAMVRKYKLSLK